MMEADRSKTVAVIGARGIGKHHAKWWALEGARVCAIVGTCDKTLSEARTKLQQLFDYRGRGYTDVERMLEAEKPDIVDICSPPGWHYEHASAALEAGCNVLCEKPFVYDPMLDREALLRQARDLLERADRRKRLLGICTQFFVAGRLCREIYEQQAPGKTLRAFRGHLASPARGRPPVAGQVWIDLAPHMIGALQAVAPGATVQWNTATAVGEGHRARVRFHLSESSGKLIEAEIVTDRTMATPINIRHIELNDQSFSLEGQNDENGVFGARIVTALGAVFRPDTMRLLIREFLSGNAIVSGQAALQNLDWTLRLHTLLSASSSTPS